jgi:uncharacterized protein (TIGR03435 family)
MRTDSRELLAVGLFGRTSLSDRIEMLLKRGREVSPRVSLIRMAATAAILLIFIIAGSSAPQWIALAQGRPSFGTASVKPFIGGSRIPATFHTLPGGSVSIGGYPLQNIIAEAYGIPEERIEGRREWMNLARFDIDAKAPGNPGKNEIKLMLQVLLENQFKLKVHLETRQLPGFVMTAAKDGLKLKPWKEGSCVVADFYSQPDPPPPGIENKKDCGAGGFLICNEGCRWKSEGMDMAQVADTLSMMMRGPVIDKTGFTGRFDVDLEWTGDRVSQFGSFATAIAERLGLQLTPTTGPVEFLILDQVEEPHAN